MAQKDRFSQGLWGQDAVAVQGRGAGEKTVLLSHSYIKTMIYQDRLGTNIGKALKKRTRLLAGHRQL
jgi:hypothetical protein